MNILPIRIYLHPSTRNPIVSPTRPKRHMASSIAANLSTRWTFSRDCWVNMSAPINPHRYNRIYPLVQVTLGAVTLNTSSQYFPPRFHLVEVLLRLSRQTGVYIPLAPTIPGPLDSSLLRATLSKNPQTSWIWDHIASFSDVSIAAIVMGLSRASRR